jgi:hypothetical protein
LPPVSALTDLTAAAIEEEDRTSRFRMVMLWELVREGGIFEGVRAVAKTWYLIV